MNKEDELDSDQSDEDFCPEKEVAGESDEEISSEETDREEDETYETEERTKKVRNVKRKNKNDKGKKRRRQKDEDEDDEDDEDEDEDETLHTDTTHKRRTRQRIGNKNDDESKTSLEKNELESDGEDKSRSDALWADFLSDVNPKPPSTGSKVPEKTTKTDSTEKKAGENVSPTKPARNGKKSPAKVGPDQATNEEKSTDKSKEITVTEIVDFAGEEVRIQKTINADSIKENKRNPPSTIGGGGGCGPSPSARGLTTGLKRPAGSFGGGISSGGGGGGGSGLGSILNQIGKKKKISVLEKSKLDWNSFKQDEGLEEELQTFNKGKDGYLERQDFLQRTDLRQFEIEKNLRQTRRNQ